MLPIPDLEKDRNSPQCRIVTRHCHCFDIGDSPIKGRPQAGTDRQGLAPVEEELVIYKPSYGAFYDTPLETILKRLHKDTVIICGALTNFCCGTTARQAYERGFKVVFGSDITATDDPAMQEPELQVLRAFRNSTGWSQRLTTVGSLQA